MATIDKRIGRNGRTTYRARVRGSGQVRIATFKRKTDAKAWASKTETALRENKHVPTSTDKRRTLAEAIDRYLRDTLPTKAHNRDRRNVKTRLEWWRGQLGAVPLPAVTPALITEYRDRLAHERNRYGGELSNATINRYLAALSHVLKTAMNEWGWLDDTPMRKVSRREEGRGRVRYLSDDERARLLAECQASRNRYLYTVVVLALSTGARHGEIMSLRWPNVDLEKEQITLHETKNRERRVLPIRGLALDLIRDLAKVRRIDSDMVFAGRKSDRPADFKNAWQHAKKRAELDDFRFHDLRHSAASYLAMSGATAPEIAAVLGHKTLQMVKRYAHLSEAHTGAVVERMNEEIFGA